MSQCNCPLYYELNKKQVSYEKDMESMRNKIDELREYIRSGSDERLELLQKHDELQRRHNNTCDELFLLSRLHRELLNEVKK